MLVFKRKIRFIRKVKIDILDENKRYFIQSQQNIAQNQAGIRADWMFSTT